MVVLRTVLRSLSSHKALAVLFIICVLIESAFVSLSPLSFKFLIDDAIIPKNISVFWFILCLLIGGGALSIVAGIVSDYSLAKVGEKTVMDLRTKLFQHTLGQSPDFFAHFETGTVMTRFTSDVSALDRLITTVFPATIRGAASLAASLYVLFHLEWKLTIFIVLSSLLMFLSPNLLRGRAEEAAGRYRLAQDGFLDIIDESLRGQKVIKSLHAKNLFLTRAERDLSCLFDAGLRVSFVFALLERIPITVFMILNVMIIGAGGYLIFQGDLSVGDFIALYTLFINVGHTVSSLSLVLPTFIQTEVSLKRIHELLAYRSNVVEAALPKALTTIRGPIVFQNVTFGYRDGQVALEDVSITIPEGGYTVFVGTSGSGKSTATSLLLRFYDPKKGAILLNETDLRMYSEHDFRQLTGVVFQDSFLFNMTIRENLALANPNATNEEIIRAAKLAQIHEMIEQMPKGYDSEITQYGNNLSGGQRQRLAIARALIRNPQLLVLDEVTSALDPATEAEINRLIESFRGTRTVISVTHRLASAVRADHIVVFQSGRVIEQGTHQQLLGQDGLYRQMWEKQSGFRLSEDGFRAQIDISRLAQLPFFAELDDEQLQQVSSMFITEKFDKGQTIIRQGAEGDKFYIIVRGTVAVMKSNDKGQSVQIAVLQDGEHFGEIALLRKIPRTADIISVTPSVLLSLQREQFFELTNRFPSMLTILEETLTDRAR